MPDYISREAALIVLDWDCASQDALDAIKAIPAADVRPVVHGKWINDHNGRYSPLGDNFFCSVCKGPSLRAYGPAKTNYCPNCGAKMDGDGE